LTTYRKFVITLEAIPDFRDAQKSILTVVSTSLALPVKAGTLKGTEQFEHLRKLSEIIFRSLRIRSGYPSLLLSTL